MMTVKICGLTRLEDIDIVNDVLPDFIGFVFAESRRKVSFEQALEMKNSLDQRIKAVGVFVNADMDAIFRLCNKGVIDLVQLHGDEDMSYISELKQRIDCPIIKAVRVQSPAQILQAQSMDCDYLLLDAYKKDTYGGTGSAFDYTLIPKFDKPFFLAGGLNAGNIAEACAQKPYCLDISSGVETDGIKDAAKIKDIITIIKKSS